MKTDLHVLKQLAMPYHPYFRGYYNFISKREAFCFKYFPATYDKHPNPPPGWLRPALVDLSEYFHLVNPDEIMRVELKPPKTRHPASTASATMSLRKPIPPDRFIFPHALHLHYSSELPLHPRNQVKLSQSLHWAKPTTGSLRPTNLFPCENSLPKSWRRLLLST